MSSLHLPQLKLISEVDESVRQVLVESSSSLSELTHIRLDDLHQKVAAWQYRLEMEQDDTFIEQPIPVERYRALLAESNKALKLLEAEWQARVEAEPEEWELAAIKEWAGRCRAPGRPRIEEFNWQKNLADIAWLGDIRLEGAAAQIQDYLSSLAVEAVGGNLYAHDQLYLRRWFKAHNALSAVQIEQFMRGLSLIQSDNQAFCRVRDLHIREADSTMSGDDEHYLSGERSEFAEDITTDADLANEDESIFAAEPVEDESPLSNNNNDPTLPF